MAELPQRLELDQVQFLLNDSDSTQSLKSRFSDGSSYCEDSEGNEPKLNGKISNVPSKKGKAVDVAQTADLDSGRSFNFRDRTYLFYGSEEITDQQATRISRSLKTMKIARKS
jgi:hypothetical protein